MTQSIKLKPKYQSLLLSRGRNPFGLGYCLVRYLPEEAINIALDAISEETLEKHGVVIAPPSNGSWPSIWAIKRHGLVKYTDTLEIRRIINAKHREFKKD